MKEVRTPMSIELIKILRDNDRGFDLLKDLGYHFYVYVSTFKSELIEDYKEENDPTMNFEGYAYRSFIGSIKDYVKKHSVVVDGELIVDEKEIEIKK